MATVTIEGHGTVAATAGRRLVLVVEDAGVDILHRCGGNARCATCRVEVLAGEAGEQTPWEVAKLATLESVRPSTRLSCQVRIEGDLTVRVVRRLSASPELGDAGPRPIEWPADRPLPPDEG